MNQRGGKQLQGDAGTTMPDDAIPMSLPVQARVFHVLEEEEEEDEGDEEEGEEGEADH